MTFGLAYDVIAQGQSDCRPPRSDQISEETMSLLKTPAYLRVGVIIGTVEVILSILPHSVLGSETMRQVTKATCGPQDRTESIQGQTTLVERFSPEPAKAFNCNLELVGQFEGEGAGADVEAFENCAYYSTAPNPMMKHPGVVVLDVSDSRRPKPTDTLITPAMLGAHESLEISKSRKLLLASNIPSTFDIYDISNCRHPRLKSSVSLSGGVVSHAGQFTEDGMTFYGAKWDPKDAIVFAIDTSDPSNPRSISRWAPSKKHAGMITHSAAVNKDATRVYVSVKRMADDWETSVNPNGLLIFDIRDIQQRRENAKFRLISTIFWQDTHGAEGIATATIRGRPYLIFSDNLGVLGFKKPSPAGVCDSVKPGHGYARIIDLSNEQSPRTIARLMLEVSDPRNCAKSVYDPTLYGSYGSFACSVDDEDNSQLLACGNFEAGLRVFDIRDPSQPRELAYYKPPARRMEHRPGSLFRPQTGAVQDNTADSVIVAPKFRMEGEEIWFTSVDNGFQVVRFTDNFKNSHPEFFGN